MSKIVVMFAGQGSQYKQMGFDFLVNSVSAKSLFDLAAKNVDFNLRDALSSDLINNTKYTQPLVFLTSAMIYSEVKKIIEPDAILGFSLGEYSAYYANGVLSFLDTLKIISKRAALMNAAANKNPGIMAAIIGLKANELETVIKELNCNVTIANYNEPNQLVISGKEECVNKVIELALEKGARRAIPLNVSGAFHSKLMNEAGLHLFNYLNDEGFVFNKPKYPMWLNTTGKKLVDEDIKIVMRDQVFSSVKFYQSIENLIAGGYNTFIEIGPGKVLTGLVKKIDRSVNVININNYSDLDKLKELD